MATPEQRLITESVFTPVAGEVESHSEDLEWSAYTAMPRHLSNSITEGQGWDSGIHIEYVRLGSGMTISAQNVSHTVSEPPGYTTLLELPEGYRPLIQVYFNTWNTIRGRVTTDGLIQLRGPRTTLDYFSVHIPVYPANPGFRPGAIL